MSMKFAAASMMCLIAGIGSYPAAAENAAAAGGIKLAQQTPDPGKPNTNKPPAGAAEIDSGIKIAAGDGIERSIKLNGTIKRIKRDDIEIDFATIGTRKLKLAPNILVTVVTPATIADIKPGIGLGMGLLELYILPPEKFATSVVVANDRRNITVGLANGDKLRVPIEPGTKVFRYAVGSRADLIAKTIVFVEIPREVAADAKSSYELSTIAVGRKGITPIMVIPPDPGPDCKRDIASGLCINR